METTKPVPDSLMFRDVSPGLWDVKRVAEHRMAAHLEAGWHVLISESEIRAEDIAATYYADQLAWRLRERL